jgi:hypothetical protein
VSERGTAVRGNLWHACELPLRAPTICTDAHEVVSTMATHAFTRTITLDLPTHPPTHSQRPRHPSHTSNTTTGQKCERANFEKHPQTLPTQPHAHLLRAVRARLVERFPRNGFDFALWVRHGCGKAVQLRSGRMANRDDVHVERCVSRTPCVCILPTNLIQWEACPHRCHAAV